jgi:transposase
LDVLALYSIISYPYGIQAYKETGKGLTYGTCSAKLPAMKKELVWLKEVDSIAMQSSVRNLADAYTRLFKKKTAHRALNLRRTTYNLIPQNKQMKTLPL